MNRLISILVALLAIVYAASPLYAQEELGRKAEKKLIEQIADSYTDWHHASWNGKLSSDLLPVSVTVKVCMEKGRLTMVSLRAPLFGEVARVELDPDSIVVANKMKHTFYSRRLSEISAMVPDLTEDVQALLLGRMFAIGCGELGKSCADAVTVFPMQADSCYMVVPEVPTICLRQSTASPPMQPCAFPHSRPPTGVAKRIPSLPPTKSTPDSLTSRKCSSRPK